MKSCEEKGAFCSYVVVQIKGQKEEDRASYRLTHANPQEGGLKSVASFGVFDGHSSKKAAEECSKRLNNQIVLAYAELLTTTGLVGTLKQDPIGLVNTNLVSDAASNRANQDRTFLAPAKGIAGSAHGSVTSSTHHSDVVNSTRDIEATVQKIGTTIDDHSSSDESGFKQDSEAWNTVGDQDSCNAKLGSVLDDSAHSAGSAHLSQTGFSSLEAKLVPSPTSTPLSTPRSSSHGASKNSRSQSPSRATGSIPEEDTREREMMKDDILHTAKQMFVHDVHDALFTEAILKETYNVDKAIKAMTNSGSTGVSLFLRKQANGSVRALCSNIGDSRCVCVTAVATLVEIQNLGPQSEPRHAPVKSSSSTSSSSSSAHITTASSSRADEATEIKHQNTYYNDLLAARKFDAVSAATNVKGEDLGNRARTVFDVSDVMCESERPDYLFAVRTTNSTLFLMSEDHNLTLPRERLRIMSRTLPPWSPLPVESFEPYLPGNMRSGMLLSSTSEPVSIFEVGALIARKVNPYPGNDLSMASEDTHDTGSDGVKQSSTTSSPLSLGKSTKWNSSVHLSAIIDRESDLENELVRRSSFSELGDLSLSNSAVAAAGSVESQFYKNSPKLATRKSLKGSSSSEQLVQTSNDPISKSKRAGLDGPPVNLAAAIGVGKVVMAHYARLAARYYLETAPSKQVLASKLIKKVRRLMNRYGTPSPGWNGSTSQPSNVYELNALNVNPEEETINYQHQESFIARRISADGKTVGPEALFGRQNVSIMMTRSIGDKTGPRSCVSFPEISSVTVPAGHHARFVLASDGFWDVVSIETVRLNALTKCFKSAKDLANMLANKAVRRRERAGLRQDDITVMVVDVNMENFTHVDKATGIKVHKLCCFKDGHVQKLTSGFFGKSCRIA